MLGCRSVDDAVEGFIADAERDLCASLLITGIPFLHFIEVRLILGESGLHIGTIEEAEHVVDVEYRSDAMLPCLEVRSGLIERRDIEESVRESSLVTAGGHGGCRHDVGWKKELID